MRMNGGGMDLDSGATCLAAEEDEVAVRVIEGEHYAVADVKVLFHQSLRHIVLQKGSA